MSFASLLDHTVYVIRNVETGDTDDYNHPITEEDRGGPLAAAIQVRSATDVARFSQAGAALSDYVIFTQNRVVTTADEILHDTTLCPKADTVDLPTMRFELVGVRNPTGRGHHLSLDAKLVQSLSQGVEGS